MEIRTIHPLERKIEAILDSIRDDIREEQSRIKYYEARSLTADALLHKYKLEALEQTLSMIKEII